MGPLDLNGQERIKGGRGRGNHLTIDYAFLSRWSTVPTPNRDPSNFWALSKFFHIFIPKKLFIFMQLAVFVSFVATIYFAGQ